MTSQTSENAVNELVAELKRQTDSGEIRWTYGVTSDVLRADLGRTECTIAYVPENRWNDASFALQVKDSDGKIVVNVEAGAGAGGGVGALGSLWDTAAKNAADLGAMSVLSGIRSRRAA